VEVGRDVLDAEEIGVVERRGTGNGCTDYQPDEGEETRKLHLSISRWIESGAVVVVGDVWKKSGRFGSGRGINRERSGVASAAPLAPPFE
jgi:hypothetical protein